MKFLVVFFYFAGFLSVYGQIASYIPSNLLKCYQSSYAENFPNPPLTIQTLIELIRKLEFDEGNTLNMRVLSNALLHSLRLDGIRRSEGLTETPYVIPYRASGLQYYKYKLIVKYLTANEPFLVPLDALNLFEKCMLHQMISSTADDRLRRDESSTCYHQSHSSESISQTSQCPIEKGVIYTKWGTVSPGTMIAAIASALETSNLPFEKIMSSMQIHQNITETKIDYSSVVLNRNISNVWTSTVAGDLGEVVILQAVSQPVMDTPGTWNDTMLPRIYYLDDTNFDFTRSELLGGIDGLILASKVASWTSILSRTRLSQILDMYYSTRGVSYNASYKACKRRDLAGEQFNNTVFLKEQVSGIAKLLQEIGLSNQLLFENTIDNFTSVVVDNFIKNYEKAINQYENCGQTRELLSSLDVITIFDETWSEYELEKTVGLLVQELDVSYYGSHLGVIHGQSGTWIANVSKSGLDIFSQLNNSTLTRSGTLSLRRSFKSIVEYLQRRNYTDCKEVGRRPRGFVIVVFAMSSLLTDEDLRWSQLSLNPIKASRPEVKLVYVTSDRNSASFETLANSYSGDIVLKTTVNDIESVVTEVSEKLANVPGHIVDFYCNKWQIAIEDYITPNKNTVYEISHEFIKRANFFVKFKGHSYGDFTVCAGDSNSEEKTCKRVVDNNVVNFTVNEFCRSYNCGVRFSISEIETRIKCTELDCRYPDQIRVNIFTYWTSGSGSLTDSITPFFIALLFYLL